MFAAIGSRRGGWSSKLAFAGDVPVTELPIVILPPDARSFATRRPRPPRCLAGAPVNDRSEVCDSSWSRTRRTRGQVYETGRVGEATLAGNTALGGQAGTSTRIENYLGFQPGHPDLPHEPFCNASSAFV